MHEQGVAARVHRRTQIARVFAGKVDVVVIADVANNFPTQQAAPSLVEGTYLLEQLCDSPRLQLCNYVFNNRFFGWFHVLLDCDCGHGGGGGHGAVIAIESNLIWSPITKFSTSHTLQLRFDY